VGTHFETKLRRQTGKQIKDRSCSGTLVGGTHFVVYYIEQSETIDGGYLNA